MFFKKRLPTKSGKTLKIKLTHFKKGINTAADENLLPLNYAKNTYNFSFVSGALTEGAGVNAAVFMKYPFSEVSDRNIKLSDGSAIENVWVYKRYNPLQNRNEHLLMLYTESKKVYFAWLFNPDPDFHELTGVNFNSCPQAINYRIGDEDTIILCSADKSDFMYTWNAVNSPQVVLDTPEITSMCVSGERLFATVSGDRSKVWFSEDLNPTNWSVSSYEGGYITMPDERGGLNKVIEFNSYVYAIRDYGISRISAIGAQENFSVSHLFVSSGKIYAKSAVLCGNKIVMLCRDGLYIFDGITTYKRTLGIEKLLEGINNEDAVATYLDGKYYLACRLNFDDGAVIGCEAENYKNNALIEYDLNTGEINLSRGIDINVILSVQEGKFSKVLAAVNGYTAGLVEIDNSGTFFNESTKKVWCSPMSDMGYPDKIKALKELFMLSENACEVRIKTENGVYAFEVKGSKIPQRIRLDIVCYMFCVEFISNSAKCRISNPQLTVGLY